MGLALVHEPVSVEIPSDEEVADILIQKLSRLPPFARSQKKMPAGKDPSGKDILVTIDELIGLLKKRPLPPAVSEHIEAQKYLMGGGYTFSKADPGKVAEAAPDTVTQVKNTPRLAENPTVIVQVPEKWQTCTISNLPLDNQLFKLAVGLLREHGLSVVINSNGDLVITNEKGTVDNKKFAQILGNLKVARPEIEIVFDKKTGWQAVRAVATDLAARLKGLIKL